jgi:hypothetical protein
MVVMEQLLNRHTDIESRLTALPGFNNFLDDSQINFLRHMYLQLIKEGTETRRLKIMEREENTEKYFIDLQRMYFTKFKSSEEKPVILTYSKKLIEKAIKEYFEMKEDEMKKKLILQFKKGCIVGNLFTGSCKIKVIDRIKEFVHKISEALEFLGLIIPRGFKLNQVDPRVTRDSIKSAYAFLNDTQKNDPDVKALVSMCTTKEDLDREQAERAGNDDANADANAGADDAANAVVTTGGRRSRYRRRPTKKYFKSRRHSLSKKKRHMKTKRHMKRHRKTKRHIKRY